MFSLANMDPRFRGDDVKLRAVHCFLLSAFCSLYFSLTATQSTTIPTTSGSTCGFFSFA